MSRCWSEDGGAALGVPVIGMWRIAASVSCHGERIVTMGSIDKSADRTTLSSFAPILVRPSGEAGSVVALRIA